MSTFTPGPWIHAEEDEHYHRIEAGCGYHVDDNDIGFDIQGCISVHDARLIAAAPDLLEALETLAEGMDACGIIGPYLETARNAIARARGEA